MHTSMLLNNSSV